jgi:hypothetical protein
VRHSVQIFVRRKGKSRLCARCANGILGVKNGEKMWDFLAFFESEKKFVRRKGKSGNEFLPIFSRFFAVLREDWCARCVKIGAP